MWKALPKYLPWLTNLLLGGVGVGAFLHKEKGQGTNYTEYSQNFSSRHCFVTFIF